MDSSGFDRMLLAIRVTDSVSRRTGQNPHFFVVAVGRNVLRVVTERLS